ncbi:magnesium transporter CorA family protein [Chloroflexales bacterium ZM16-3]|nr:magnesium transporter CorA family protein [Chloroflexales bacterium ZM16-3]
MNNRFVSHTAPPNGIMSDPTTAHKSFTEGGLTWVDVMCPSRDEVLALADHYHFHPLHAEDVLSKLQRPKIDENDEEEYLFLVLHFPVFNEVDRLSVTSEVDIFVGRDYVVTFHDGQLRPMRRLSQTADDDRGRQLLMGRSSGFLIYRQIEALINYCFPMLYRLDEKLDALEEHIFRRDVQTTVQELSFLRRDIIALRRILKPNIPVVRYLAARERDFLRLDEDAYFGDLTDGLTRIWDMLEEHKDIIEGLDSTLSSLTSHRINQEMKIFTLISVIMLPMTLVASILGMNVAIPYADHPLALPATLLLMIIIAASLYIFFRFKRMV